MKNDIGLLILRIAMGALLLLHGIGKITRLSSFPDIHFADPVGLGPAVSLILTIVAEVLCAFLVIVGYKTKFATIPLMILFFVITFVVHIHDPWAKQEIALLYLSGFASLYFLGSGRFSIDYWLSKKN
jgi:putative oxidoreductase